MDHTAVGSSDRSGCTPSTATSSRLNLLSSSDTTGSRSRLRAREAAVVVVVREGSEGGGGD